MRCFVAERVQRIVADGTQAAVPRGHVRRRRGHRDRRASRRTRSCRSRTASSWSATRRSATPPSSACGSIVFTICPGFFQPLEQEVGPGAREPAGAGHRRRAAREAGRDARRHPRARRDRRARSPRSARSRRRCSTTAACCSSSLIIGIVAYYVDLHRPGHARGQRPLRPVRQRCSAPRASCACSRRVVLFVARRRTRRASTASRSCCRRSPRWSSRCAARSTCSSPGPRRRTPSSRPRSATCSSARCCARRCRTRRTSPRSCSRSRRRTTSSATSRPAS